MSLGGKSQEELRTIVEGESSDGQALVLNLWNNPICVVGVDDSVPCLTVEWKQYATSAQLRYVLSALIPLLKERSINRILGDDTRLPTVTDEDKHWVINTWLPAAASGGLHAVASIVPQSYFGKLAVAAVQNALAPELQVGSFLDANNARLWLKAVKVD